MKKRSKKSKKQSKLKSALKMPVNASKFLTSQALKLPKQSFNVAKLIPSQSLRVLKPVSSATVKASKSLASRVDSNFMVVLLVAIVAIVGLAMAFNPQNNATGAALSVIKGEGFDTAPTLISDEGNFVYKGRMLFDECHLNLEERSKLVAPSPGEELSENECCARSCQEFCLIKDERNCPKLCKVGCDTESKALFKTGGRVE